MMHGLCTTKKLEELTDFVEISQGVCGHNGTLLIPLYPGLPYSAINVRMAFNNMKNNINVLEAEIKLREVEKHYENYLEPLGSAIERITDIVKNNIIPKVEISNVIDLLDKRKADGAYMEHNIGDIRTNSEKALYSQIEKMKKSMDDALTKNKKPPKPTKFEEFGIEVEQTETHRVPAVGAVMGFCFVVNFVPSGSDSSPIDWIRVDSSMKAYITSEEDIGKRLKVECFVVVNGESHRANVTITDRVIKHHGLDTFPPEVLE
ncbi:hypothetical protein COLO4_29015 [Corchorus olitorius]|uniref:Uncharacterized protein n=1 Tax=Corchorus olitorius TaxID=93759 RepID=A0A1R3HGT4_9ROSI|nr:hypothetical protein COLO4_29015 [Corchorus olitorius]